MADDYGLTPVQSGFLGLLRFADRMGFAPTSLRLYNQMIQDGRTSPITESDFSPAELNELRGMVQKKTAADNATAGHFDYKDYPGGNMLISDRSKEAGQIMNTLGGFNYAVDPSGGIKVTDKYDFNANRGGALDNNQFVQALSMVADPRGLAASIGRKVLPDTSGRGVPVEINLSPQFGTMADQGRSSN